MTAGLLDAGDNYLSLLSPAGVIDDDRSTIAAQPLVEPVTMATFPCSIMVRASSSFFKQSS
jgi:hypothetical protein